MTLDKQFVRCCLRRIKCDWEVEITYLYYGWSEFTESKILSSYHKALAYALSERCHGNVEIEDDEDICFTILFTRVQRRGERRKTIK